MELALHLVYVISEVNKVRWNECVFVVCVCVCVCVCACAFNLSGLIAKGEKREQVG